MQEQGKIFVDKAHLSCYNSKGLGGLAQLGERLTGSQEVSGSIPLISTKKKALKLYGFGAFLHLVQLIYSLAGEIKNAVPRCGGIAVE